MIGVSMMDKRESSFVIMDNFGLCRLLTVLFLCRAHIFPLGCGHSRKQNTQATKEDTVVQIIWNQGTQRIEV